MSHEKCKKKTKKKTLEAFFTLTQVETIRPTKTNQTGWGTHKGRARQPTGEGTGFQNKTGSHEAMNATELTDFDLVYIQGI